MASKPTLSLALLSLCLSQLSTGVLSAPAPLDAAAAPPSVDIGYDVAKASNLSSSYAKSNWEWGTEAEALLELYDPDVSVFSTTAFPNGKIPNKATTGTTYGKKFIQLSGNTLTAKGSSAGDPASLGVSAILLGVSSSSTYSQAATRQVNELLNNAPRSSTGAISHRYDSVMLWSDFIYMAPPTLAYQGVATNNVSLLQTAVTQISLYRDALRDSKTGLWTHITGSRRDAGTWSTGNGWAAGGIARVYATIHHWSTSDAQLTKEKTSLIQFAGEIFDGAIAASLDSSNSLLRNYITDTTSFGEVAGTASITAAIYRFAVLAPETFATSKYLNWADARRQAIAKRVDSTGKAAPVINPYKYQDTAAYGSVSPEAQSFLVLLYAAYRDYVATK